MPPSESKASGGHQPWFAESGRFGALLGNWRHELAVSLAASPPGSLTLTGERREAALLANRLVADGRALSLPCHERYTGVVWEALSPATLSPEARQRAQRSLLTVSGLGGVFAWDDPVPEYRLKMGSSIHDLGRVDRFWSGLIGQAIVDALEDDRIVLDLLPVEHFRAVELPVGSLATIVWLRPEIVGPDGRRSGHGGKAAKGRLARALLESKDPLACLSSYQDQQGFLLRESDLIPQEQKVYTSSVTDLSLDTIGP